MRRLEHLFRLQTAFFKFYELMSFNLCIRRFLGGFLPSTIMLANDQAIVSHPQMSSLRLVILTGHLDVALEKYTVIYWIQVLVSLACDEMNALL